MSTATRLAGFGLGLVTVLGAGAGLGATIGPDIEPAAAEAPAPMGHGVVAAEEGYRFVPVSSSLDPDGGPFRFTIADQQGRSVREFTALHGRELHLIVVDRGLTDFHHVHPKRDHDGTWSIALPALAAGSYRAIADFQVAGGPRLALGTDLTVSGPYRPTGLPEPHATDTVDGYEVTLDARSSDAGELEATLTVRRDGEVVDDLQPYLGAHGHLVAIRAGDLAYAHVHPVEEGGDAGSALGVVAFEAELESAGRYGLFFDFKHGGEVHTAAFTFDQGAVTRDAGGH